MPKPKWKAKKVIFHQASQDAYKIIGPKMIHDYEDYGYNKEDAELMASAPELEEKLDEIEAIVFEAIDKFQENSEAFKILSQIKKAIQKSK